MFFIMENYRAPAREGQGSSLSVGARGVQVGKLIKRRRERVKKYIRSLGSGRWDGIFGNLKEILQILNIWFDCGFSTISQNFSWQRKSSKINQVEIELIKILKDPIKWINLEPFRLQNPHWGGQNSGIFEMLLSDCEKSMRWADLRQSTSGACGAWMMNNLDTTREITFPNNIISSTQYV